MAVFPGSEPTNSRRSLPARSESARPRLQKTLYGRRKGPKLSAHQASLVESLLPRLIVHLRKGADPRRYFNVDVHEVWLEIGFGAGEHLLWQAQHHRNIGIIGAEPYEPGVAKLLSKLYAFSPTPGEAGDKGDAEDLPSRIRVHTGDARDIIDALPDASLSRVFLLFPDPWPKKRHHKRRFVQTGTLDALARVMKSGAEFRFASDDPEYVAWVLECVRAHSAFAWSAKHRSDWLSRSEDWPVTRYEQKALHGTPAYLRFQRRGNEAFVGLANRALTA